MCQICWCLCGYNKKFKFFSRPSRLEHNEVLKQAFEALCTQYVVPQVVHGQKIVRLTTLLHRFQSLAAKLADTDASSYT